MSDEESDNILNKLGDLINEEGDDESNGSGDDDLVDLGGMIRDLEEEEEKEDAEVKVVYQQGVPVEKEVNEDNKSVEEENKSGDGEEEENEEDLVSKLLESVQKELEDDDENIEEVNEDKLKEKVYAFTEVSSGTGNQGKRRYSQSDTKISLDLVQVGKPLIKDSNVSEYTLDHNNLQKTFESIRSSLDKKVDRIRMNQSEIYKHCLMINIMSEEIYKLSNPLNQKIHSGSNEEMMRYHEMLELDLMKNKTHMNFISERMEMMEKSLDDTFQSLIEKYKNSKKKKKKKEEIKENED